ncbi:alanine racemase [Jonesia quinghaiensis]|uniref:alanine racemase n=1 Tax=Jonesia quinghaiensis TaxID=262806 RepID=UPI000416F047|nr:alanine racemase [Jonesia quinghaiensis]
MSSAPLSRRLSQATKHLPAPVCVVDGDAVLRNADELVARAAGHPIRLATKSLRVRGVIETLLVRDGFRGLMAYSLREALWLFGHGLRDILVAYPSVDTDALRELAEHPQAREHITLVVDCVEHIAMIAAAQPGTPVRVVLDVDASLHIFERLPRPLHIGVRRSPLHSPNQVAEFAQLCRRSPAIKVVGAMFYDAQIAGLPDASALHRVMKSLSHAELTERRQECCAALAAEVGPLELVNVAGTGSLHRYGGAQEITEVTAGSGIFHPALFDAYDVPPPLGQALEPAVFLGLDVVRRPAPGIVTAFSGGYVASGPAGRNRLPRPVEQWLRLTRSEGAGEVQTPVRVAKGHHSPKVGERVWLRHAKAGEQMERFTHVHLMHDGAVTSAMPTYRGEGVSFG